MLPLRATTSPADSSGVGLSNGALAPPTRAFPTSVPGLVFFSFFLFFQRCLTKLRHGHLQRDLQVEISGANSFANSTVEDGKKSELQE